MSDQVFEPPVTPATQSAPEPSHRTKKWRLLATLISAAIPGSGHLLLGLRRKGFLLFVCLILLLACFWPLRLLRFFAGFIVLYVAWIAVFLYAALNAQLTRNPVAGVRPSRWWLAATIPVTLLTLSLLGRGITRASGFRAFNVPSISMEPTIQRGDGLVADMWYYRSRLPARSDVVVFVHDGIFSTKRVIAVGGDTIEGKNDLVYLNGNLIEEGYVEHRESGNPSGYEWMRTFGPKTIPSDNFFVMGDNRDVSLDSRSPDVGLIDRSAIVGKMLYVYGTDRAGMRIR